jgi:uncharacterized protein YigA (DUF484 family)
MSTTFNDTQPIPPITEEDIANYLVQTPDFFERHAEVLASVQLSSPHGGRAVSLQERQAELLRDKIRGLERKASDMIRFGHENMGIGDKLQGWTFGLLKAADAGELPTVIARDLALCFDVPQTALRLWDVAPAWEATPFAQGCSDDVKAFATSLVQPYCGSNPGLEAVSWLDEPTEAKSLALIALREEPGAPSFGLLVLASPDVRRFQTDMGHRLSGAHWRVGQRCAVAPAPTRLIVFPGGRLARSEQSVGSAHSDMTAATLSASDAELVQRYLQHVQVEKRLALRTLALYTIDLDKLAAAAVAARVSLTEVQTHHVRRWVAHMHAGGRSGRGIALILSGWRGVLCVVGSHGDHGAQPRAGCACTQGTQALAQGLGRGRGHATGHRAFEDRW